MRIAFVSTMANLPWGESEELWFQTAELALLQNHKVMTLTPNFRPVPPKILELTTKGASIFTWNAHARTRDHNLIEAIPEYFPYHTLIEWRPDFVVISHNYLLDIVNGHHLLIDLLIRLGISYFVLIQTNTELSKLNTHDRPILQAYLAHAKKVFFVSRGNLSLAQKQLASKIENALVINNPINLADYSEVQFPDNSNQLEAKFATVGRLDTNSKGQDVLFEVLGSEVWLNRSWSLTLFGVGEDEEYLRNLAEYYGVSKRIHFDGQTQNAREIWAENHLLLLPSRIEGTPQALLEAMFWGRSAVVTNIGGNAEWIANDVNGFVAEAPFPAPFSDALDRAWNLRSKWEDLGKLCRETFIKNYEVESNKTLLRYIQESAPVKILQSRKETRLTTTPKVSVIIPCYNLAYYLKECVDSVISQTFQDFEIIIVNPSSPDSTTNIAKKLITENPLHSIRIIEMPNFGQPAYSRNHGIKEANGAYILCLDADDFISPTMLEKTVRLLDLHLDADIAFSDYQTFEERSDIIRTGPFDLEMLATQNRLATCSLYRKSLWEKLGGYKTNCPGYEDWDFWLSAAEYGSIGIHIQEVLFFYRIRNGSFLKDAEKKHDELLAKIILNHPILYTEDTKKQATELLTNI